MALTAPQVANCILEHLAAREANWKSTQELIDMLAREISWPQSRQNKVRQVLQLLTEDGKIDRRGTGKMQWRIRNTDWDRSRPLSNPNVWRSVRPAGPRSPAGPVAPVAMPTVVHNTTITPEEIRDVVGDELADMLDEKVREMLDATVQVVKGELIAAGVIKTEISIKINDTPAVKVDGKLHKSFDRVVQLAAARQNVLLVGPAGSGKTHLAEQVATALGLDFAHISCSVGMSEGQLLGRLMPRGKAGQFEYVRSEFVRCYEEGGVFLFDEIDAADSNTLLVINAALANGKMALPNRPENPVAVKHKDFVCIAAANTFGTGADRQYVGRNQLDESTLDRFRIGQIAVDYDEDVEAELCPDEDLRDLLQSYRRKVMNAKVRRVVSTRFLKSAYTMKVGAGWTHEQIEDALLGGWTADEKAKVGIYR